MSKIVKYIANASGEFNEEILGKIDSSFRKATKIAEEKLKANKIDVIFVNAPRNIIPEIGIGGYSTGPYNIYISLDPNFTNFLEEDMVLTILHEAHHCMRYRKPGYGKTLGEAMVSEGLAALFEAEINGKPPIYATVKIKAKEIENAKNILNSEKYSQGEWFFGDKNIQRWFGYTYGYRLCKSYSKKTGRTAAELVSVKAKLMLE